LLVKVFIKFQINRKNQDKNIKPNKIAPKILSVDFALSKFVQFDPERSCGFEAK
jgi:hypothetical protein